MLHLRGRNACTLSSGSTTCRLCIIIRALDDHCKGQPPSVILFVDDKPPRDPFSERHAADFTPGVVDLLVIAEEKETLHPTEQRLSLSERLQAK